MQASTLIVVAVGAFMVLSPAPGGQVESPIPDDVRERFGLDPTYAKLVSIGGFPIVSTGEVDDFALREAASLIDRMLGAAPRRDEVLGALVDGRVRFVVMAHDEFTTQVPEHSDLAPAKYWDRRTRGLGATTQRPAVSCGEENLLGYPGDPYRTENILIHEFAHAIHEMGMNVIDPTFDGRLVAAYDDAIANGRWAGTYAATNKSEYWAEGVQSWFDTNRENDALHNHVDTREELLAYDPPLGALIREVFGDDGWRYVHPLDRRPGSPHLAGYDVAAAPAFAWPALLEAWYQGYEARDESSEHGRWRSLEEITPEAPLRSVASDRATSVLFVNATPGPVTIDWIDNAGESRPYGRLGPGEAFTQPTFVGHVWVARDAHGKRVRAFVADAGAKAAIITE